jgi:hypothetical protein
VAALSGDNSTSTLRVFDVFNGELITETRIPHHGYCDMNTVSGIAFAQDNTDVLALVCGRRVVRFDGIKPTQRWAWTAPDDHPCAPLLPTFFTTD